jgi:hypothetical protein
MAGVTTPVESPNAYANADDMGEFWKPLDGADATRANSLLKLASNRLRTLALKRNIVLDDKVNADAAYFSNVQWVIMEAAKRAMLTPADAPPANSIQRAAGPYSENIVFTNPSGDLWFKKSELKDLGIGGISRMTGYSTSPRDIYSPYPDTIESA